MMYKVYHPEYMGDDDYWEIKAFDHEHAATKYMEYYEDNSGEPSDSIEVTVVDDDGLLTMKLKVTGEYSRHYYAREM